MLKFFLGSFIFLYFPLKLEAAFEKVNGLREAEINFIALHPFNDKIIYISSQDALYRRDENSQWQLIYRVNNGEINFIYPDPCDYNLLYLATDAGVLFTRDGERFEYIFRQRSQNIKCFCVRRIADKLYIGTNQGLYQVPLDSYNFKKIHSLPQDIEVYWIESGQGYVFLATSQGVYRSKDFRQFQRTFLVTDAAGYTFEDSQKKEESEKSADVPRVILKDVKNPSRIYLGTDNGLFISNNKGLRFLKAYFQNLPRTKINFLLEDKDMPDVLYAATNKGFFKIYPQRRVAMKVYEGLPTGKINCIGIDRKGKIYLATSQGLFTEGEDSREFMEKTIRHTFSREPSFREVQKAALEYNEVSPRKIRAWRRRLKIRALMPSIGLGYDKTISSYSGGKFYVGPQDWSLDFSWDLGNLIWNSYEDDIDTRSRLNTQLRLDILEEVNRLYFERRRVELELMNNPPKNPQEYMKKSLYLEELTAALDAYTGGYFSRRLQELQNPISR